MSGCADTCVYVEHDAYPEFHDAKVVVARKPHQCCECNAVIAIGESYERVAGKWDGDFRMYKTCAPCAEIRKAFCCDAWLYEMLWEDIRDQMFPVWQKVGPYDCLAELTTEKARDLCRTKFADYLNDQ